MARWVSALAVQTQEPEYNSQTATQTAGMATPTYNLSALGVQRQEDYWDWLPAQLQVQ